MTIFHDTLKYIILMYLIWWKSIVVHASKRKGEQSHRDEESTQFDEPVLTKSCSNTTSNRVDFKGNPCWLRARWKSDASNTLYAVEANTSCADPARCQGTGSRSTIRWGHARSCISHPVAGASGRSEWICFEPRARCQGVAREMPVTPAEVTYDSDSVLFDSLLPSKVA